MASFIPDWRVFEFKFRSGCASDGRKVWHIDLLAHCDGVFWEPQTETRETAQTQCDSVCLP